MSAGRRLSRALRTAARRPVALVALIGLAACLAPQAAQPPDAATEDNLRFRVDRVDTSLPDVDAIGYEVDLVVNDVPGQETYAADVKGSYVATRSIAKVALDFEGNVIDSVLVGGRPARYRRDGSKLVIELPTAVAAGQAITSRVRYHGTVAQADGANPNDFAAFGGLNVRQRNAEGKRIYSSLSWPSKARRWLPVRDRPSDGAMLVMNVTFPKTFTVLANGKQVSRADSADGKRTWRYEALTPMPTYDFHVAAYEGWKPRKSARRSACRSQPTRTRTPTARAARSTPICPGRSISARRPSASSDGATSASSRSQSSAGAWSTPRS